MSDIVSGTVPAPVDAARVAHRPRPFVAFKALYGLLLRNQLTRGKSLALGGLGLVGIAVGLAVTGSSNYDATIAGTRFVNRYSVSLFTPVVALVFGSGVLGDLVEDQSLVYLWLPPVPRWVIAVAAWGATMTVCIPFGVVMPVVMATATGGGTNLVTGTAWASIITTIAYSGLFTALGLRFKRALVWGFVYLLIWETFIARAGAGTARLSILSYARSLLSAYTGVGLPIADRDLILSFIVPVVVGILGVIYTARRLHTQDID